MGGIIYQLHVWCLVVTGGRPFVHKAWLPTARARVTGATTSFTLHLTGEEEENILVHKTWLQTVHVSRVLGATISRRLQLTGDQHTCT